MSMQYFDPAQLQLLEGAINYITKAGSSFAILPNGEQVFLNVRLTQDNKLDVGDSVRVLCVDNLKNSETLHYPSRWRGVRVQSVRRIEDIVGEAPNTAPAPKPAAVSYGGPTVDLYKALDAELSTDRPWSTKELAYAVVRKHKGLTNSPDLVQKVRSRLETLHANGEIAVLKVYASGEQTSASAVYFAKNVDVFYEHLDTPLSDEG